MSGRLGPKEAAMKRSSIYGLLVFAIALDAQISALAQTSQENVPQASEPWASKLEVACEQLRMGVQAY